MDARGAGKGARDPKGRATLHPERELANGDRTGPQRRGHGMHPCTQATAAEFQAEKNSCV